MKTKELATDELLKMATPRPWKCTGEGLNSKAYVFSQADAHLLVRATNSFEAMREALKLMLERATPLSKCNVKRDYSYMIARVAAENALRLSEGEPDRWANRYAEGKAVQS